MSSAAKWLLTILILGLLHLVLLVLYVATLESVYYVFPFGRCDQQELASIALVELSILAVMALAFVILLHRSDDN